jgi:hypothetical protein
MTQEHGAIFYKYRLNPCNVHKGEIISEELHKTAKYPKPQVTVV